VFCEKRETQFRDQANYAYALLLSVQLNSEWDKFFKVYPLLTELNELVYIISSTRWKWKLIVLFSRREKTTQNFTKSRLHEKFSFSQKIRHLAQVSSTPTNFFKLSQNFWTILLTFLHRCYHLQSDTFWVYNIFARLLQYIISPFHLKG
jgi:hypothetical protein